MHHVHVHIIPRKALDYENNDDIYPDIEKNGAGGRMSKVGGLDIHERSPRSLDEMAKEASILRKELFDRAAVQFSQ